MPTTYRTTLIDGLSIFYREAGPKDAATLLVLNGLLVRCPPAADSARAELVAPDSCMRLLGGAGASRE